MVGTPRGAAPSSTRPLRVSVAIGECLARSRRCASHFSGSLNASTANPFALSGCVPTIVSGTVSRDSPNWIVSASARSSGSCCSVAAASASSSFSPGRGAIVSRAGTRTSSPPAAMRVPAPSIVSSKSSGPGRATFTR